MLLRDAVLEVAEELRMGDGDLVLDPLGPDADAAEVADPAQGVALDVVGPVGRHGHALVDDQVEGIEHRQVAGEERIVDVGRAGRQEVGVELLDVAAEVAEVGDEIRPAAFLIGVEAGEGGVMAVELPELVGDPADLGRRRREVGVVGHVPGDGEEAGEAEAVGLLEEGLDIVRGRAAQDVVAGDLRGEVGPLRVHEGVDDEEVPAQAAEVLEVGADVRTGAPGIDEAHDGIVGDDPAAEEPRFADGQRRRLAACPDVDGVEPLGTGIAEGDRGLEGPSAGFGGRGGL